MLEQPGGVSILRIEPVRAGRDDAPYECVAENGVGDAVSADATLTIYEGECEKPSVYVHISLIEAARRKVLA